MNKQTAWQVLKEVRDILNRIKVPYFLMGGVLLGVIRDGDFISHDDDIDIGIFIEDWKSEIIEELKKAGFKWELQLGTKESGLEYRFNKNGIQLDIFFWYKEQDYYWYAAYWKENKPENIIKLRFDKFVISSTKFWQRGELFSIPLTSEHWLEQIYGQDWQTPNPNWHWCASCQNIIQAPFEIKKEKRICLGMIVKNESHIIKQSLESVKSIIDYWVIIDTGSSDNTKEIIKETLKGIPGELIERPWVNFGHNRTEVATLCKSHGDYFLILDADEIIINNNFDKKLLIADSYRVIVNEYDYSYCFGILMKNSYEWKSIGATHEYWTAKGANVTENLKTLSMQHLGTGIHRNKKFETDIKLLEEGIKNEPKNKRYMFYLAQSYCNVGNYEKAMEWYQKRILEQGWNEEICYSLYMLSYCSLVSKKPFEESVDYVFKAYMMNPASAESLYLLLRYCRQIGKFNFGYYIGKIAEKIPCPKNQVLWIKKEVYDYKIIDELSICAYYLEKYQESLDLCNKILDNDLCPKNERPRIIQNKIFSEKKLGINIEKYRPFSDYDEKTQNKIIDEMKNTELYFIKEFGLDIYPVYGTLLGMIRENNLIQHDTDVDMAYLSKFHTEKEVLEEFNQLCGQLKKRGLLLKKIKTASHIHVYSPDKEVKLDLWISWIDKNNKYYLVWIFDGEFDKSIILPFKQGKLKHQTFNLMNNYEQFLTFRYDNWKTIIKGTEKDWNKRKPIFRLEQWQNE